MPYDRKEFIETMTAMASTIEDVLNESNKGRIQFMLFMCDQTDPDRKMSCMGNIVAEHMVLVLKDFLAEIEKTDFMKPKTMQ